MVRLATMLAVDREHLLAKRCPRLPGAPWVAPKPLATARVALVTTAGLHRRDDRPFPMASTGYRRIADDTAGADIVMSHTSHNFDRTGFYSDFNVAFPRDRLREMVAGGEVGSAASRHYAFMGGHHEPEDFEQQATAAATELIADDVDVVFLTPV